MAAGLASDILQLSAEKEARGGFKRKFNAGSGDTYLAFTDWAKQQDLYADIRLATEVLRDRWNDALVDPGVRKRRIGGVWCIEQPSQLPQAAQADPSSVVPKTGGDATAGLSVAVSADPAPDDCQALHAKLSIADEYRCVTSPANGEDLDAYRSKVLRFMRSKRRTMQDHLRKVLTNNSSTLAESKGLIGESTPSDHKVLAYNLAATQRTVQTVAENVIAGFDKLNIARAKDIKELKAIRDTIDNTVDLFQKGELAHAKTARLDLMKFNRKLMRDVARQQLASAAVPSSGLQTHRCGACREDVPAHLTSMWSRTERFCNECRNNYNRYNERIKSGKQDTSNKSWFKSMGADERERWFKRHKQLNAERIFPQSKRRFDDLGSLSLGLTVLPSPVGEQKGLEGDLRGYVSPSHSPSDCESDLIRDLEALFDEAVEAAKVVEAE